MRMTIRMRVWQSILVAMFLVQSGKAKRLNRVRKVATRRQLDPKQQIKKSKKSKKNKEMSKLVKSSKKSSSSGKKGNGQEGEPTMVPTASPTVAPTPTLGSSDPNLVADHIVFINSCGHPVDVVEAANQVSTMTLDEGERSQVPLLSIVGKTVNFQVFVNLETQQCPNCSEWRAALNQEDPAVQPYTTAPWTGTCNEMYTAYCVPSVTATGGNPACGPNAAKIGWGTQWELTARVGEGSNSQDFPDLTTNSNASCIQPSYCNASSTEPECTDCVGKDQPIFYSIPIQWSTNSDLGCTFGLDVAKRSSFECTAVNCTDAYTWPTDPKQVICESSIGQRGYVVEYCPGTSQLPDLALDDQCPSSIEEPMLPVKCGGVVDTPGTDTAHEICSSQLWDHTSPLNDSAAMPCYSHGGPNDPCALSFSNDGGGNFGLDKDPSLCPNDVFYLWNEPTNNYPGIPQEFRLEKTANLWTEFVDKWSIPPPSQRSRKYTTPLFHWGQAIDTGDYQTNFFDNCPGCNDPTSPYYLDIFAVNGFCGTSNIAPTLFNCSKVVDYILTGHLNHSLTEIAEQYNLPLYITKWSAVGDETTLPTVEDQVTAMEAVAGFHMSDQVERVYWNAGADDAGLMDSTNTLNTLYSNGTLGELWAVQCSKSYK